MANTLNRPTTKSCAVAVAHISAAYGLLARKHPTEANLKGKDAAHALVTLFKAKGLVDKMPETPAMEDEASAREALKVNADKLRHAVGDAFLKGDIASLKRHRDHLKTVYNLAQTAAKNPRAEELHHTLMIELYLLGVNTALKPGEAAKELGAMLAKVEFQIAGLALEAAIEGTLKHSS
jgi:hypothetical protein